MMYPAFLKAFCNSESILNSAEPGFLLMSQQVILDSTQVFYLYSIKFFFGPFCLRSFSISHCVKKVCHNYELSDLPGRSLRVNF